MNYIGYWKRGKQYWHITTEGSIMIHLAEKNYHYNGDGYIFFENYDSPVHTHEGRVRISQDEFDLVRDNLIKQIKQY